ncbi:ATP-binding cassette domain-containing protein [Rubrobacter tropicus]|uniref:ATP-binding cassette domain-containing protein n=1 Tax=Rubrobacter tropicus TaxID=2653851 RepID=A0A6G8Q4Z7_9ACTN|nr:sugar ABC transporter ATP-binding protein [Rubrobacter tropicus]QIN81513.1 ATP-binding cassette domain-containing protein [Rubrobacter tropicus]
MSLSEEPGTERAATVAETPPVFRLRDVTKRFGGVTAVEGVSFDLRPGEVHALVGENGAGKSTLMKMVHGLYAPDEGTLEVGGEAAEFSSPRDAEAAGIAMIPQELDLFPELSVTENLFVGRHRPRTRWGTLDRTAMRAEARGRLRSLGVDLDVTTSVKGLSAANQQIVAIARALVGEARAVVMDEPTASLTEREVRQLFRIISDLTAGGVGVAYISHRLEEIFTISDRITVLRDGHHITTAPAADLDSEELVRLMVGRPLNELFTRSAHNPGEVALEVRGLSRAGEFEDVDLVVRRSEIVGLSGLVGAGRSEVAQAIFGIRSPESGEIRIDGEVVQIRSPQAAMERGIFYVPEERRSQGLILPFSIKNNITLSILDRIARFGFVPRTERQTADRFAKGLSIRGGSVSDPVSRLSGGNQQKVVLAKSLAREPSILLLDEPTRGIDVGAKSEIYRLIDDLAKEGKAILLISSELEEVLSMSDRVVVMREGRITGEFGRNEASQEMVMTAATGGKNRPAGPGEEAPEDE